MASESREVQAAYKKMLKRLAKVRGIDPKLVDEGKFILDGQGLPSLLKGGRKRGAVNFLFGRAMREYLGEVPEDSSPSME